MLILNRGIERDDTADEVALGRRLCWVMNRKDSEKGQRAIKTFVYFTGVYFFGGELVCCCHLVWNELMILLFHRGASIFSDTSFLFCSNDNAASWRTAPYGGYTAGSMYVSMRYHSDCRCVGRVLCRCGTAFRVVNNRVIYSIFVFTNEVNVGFAVTIHTGTGC